MLPENTKGYVVPTRTLEEDQALATKHGNQYPSRLRNAQIAHYLTILEESGNPGTAADMVGLTLRTIQVWRKRSASFSQKYDESLRIGELSIEHQLTGKMDSEALSKPFDKVTSILAMFRTKKLNPQYKDTQQVNVNVAGPAALQFVIGESSTASPQPDTTTGDKPRKV